MGFLEVLAGVTKIKVAPNDLLGPSQHVADCFLINAQCCSDLRHLSLSETATLQSAAIIVTCNSSTGYLLAGAVIFVDIYLFVFNKQL